MLRIVRNVRWFMYVCVCNGLTERQVRSAAISSASERTTDVFAQLGCAMDCGMCAGHARKVIRSARDMTDAWSVPAE
jgi:bacterioferritin-associated ferredoxin